MTANPSSAMDDPSRYRGFDAVTRPPQDGVEAVRRNRVYDFRRVGDEIRPVVTDPNPGQILENVEADPLHDLHAGSLELVQVAEPASVARDSVVGGEKDLGVGMDRAACEELGKGLD